METSRYKNKYRVASARAQWWDYSWNGAYFITICTKNRRHYFGEIIDKQMELSHVGVLADVFWHEIKHHTHGVELDAFVVMPNHIHGILVLDHRLAGTAKTSGEMDKTGFLEKTANKTVGVETRHALSLQIQIQSQSRSRSQSSEKQPPNKNHPGENHPEKNSSKKQSPGQTRYQNQGKNTVSSIMGSYKSAVTKHARRLGFEFEWQARFHDRIIRD
ncbi:MAG: transposase, partial [Bacteroidetes bacterium]|nr:transposase [Bacteroidota bacterium]